MLNLYFYFLQFLLKIQSCEKSVKNENEAMEKRKVTSFVKCFLLSRVIVKKFYENFQNQWIFAMVA